MNSSDAKRQRPICETCKSWRLDEQETKDIGNIIGTCRYDPPKMRSPSNSYGNFPFVPADGWCRCWQPNDVDMLIDFVLVQDTEKGNT